MLKRLFSKLGILLIFLVWALVSCGFFLLFLEGGAHLYLLWRAQNSGNRFAETLHTTYHPELGWSGLPNFSEENMYGTWRYLRLDQDGFRNTDRSTQAETGKFRILCSGDSFTFGYGVSNEDTWCASLEALDPRIQTVNLALGGYGFDQIFLGALNPINKFDHKVHIVALIDDDFERMRRSNFFGYPKPLLGLKDGKVRAINTPLPYRSFFMPWLIGYSELFRQLSILQLVRGWFGTGAVQASHAELSVETTREYVTAALAELQTEEKGKGAQLLVVLLPRPDQFDAQNNFWGDFLKQHMPEGAAYLDLHQHSSDISQDEYATLFIGGDSEVASLYRFAAGHFTEKGNHYFAKKIYAALSESILPGGAAPPRRLSWRMQYFNGVNFERPQGSELVETPSSAWSVGSLPPGVGPEHFSARWESNLVLEQPAHYEFLLRSDDGGRLFVDEQMLIDQWREGGANKSMATIDLKPGTHKFRVEYFNYRGKGEIDLRYRVNGSLPRGRFGPEWHLPNSP